MKQLIYLAILFFFSLTNVAVCQTSGNIPLSFKGKFGGYYGSGDVWGIQINGTNYALATLDGGLSIINTNNTEGPLEIVHINHTEYDSLDPDAPRLSVPDVETFVYSGITYAYLATDKKGEDPSFPLVMIINLNQAISTGGEILIDPYNPSGNVYVGKIDDFSEIDRSHTLTIAGNYLYVATLNQYLPVWDLNQNPTSPPYLGAVTIDTPEAAVHEMSVRPINSLRAKIYAACVVGGLQVIDVSYTVVPPLKGGSTFINVNSITEHLYDFDKAYPDTMESGDPLFDYRATHSAWPTDDGSYIFTTDELLIWPPNWPNQYSGLDRNLYGSNGELKSPRREGTWLRTWDAALLGNTNSYKGGYFVAEDYYKGITDLSIIDTNWVPNTIHQMHSKGDYLYVAHYSEGFRMLDISDPENIIELGYYDDYPEISFDPSSDYFFRSVIPGGGTWNWAAGIYGVFPDKNRPNICYAGGTGGFYIFDVTPPPLPPTNLTVTEVNTYAQLNWEPNLDPDVFPGGKYKIYNRSTDGSEPLSWSLRATINTSSGSDTVTQWTDPLPEVGSGSLKLFYVISSVNTSNYESVKSNYDWVEWDGNINFKQGGGGISKKNIDYELFNNYPNPFNPSTQISYSLARDADVTVKVYDMLGIEVLELLNVTQAAGNYEINFNGENLASGVYIYRLVAGKNGRVSFTDTKQMILIK